VDHHRGVVGRWVDADSGCARLGDGGEGLVDPLSDVAHRLTNGDTGAVGGVRVGGVGGGGGWWGKDEETLPGLGNASTVIAATTTTTTATAGGQGGWVSDSNSYGRGPSGFDSTSGADEGIPGLGTGRSMDSTPVPPVTHRQQSSLPSQDDMYGHGGQGQTNADDWNRGSGQNGGNRSGRWGPRKGGRY